MSGDSSTTALLPAANSTERDHRALATRRRPTPVTYTHNTAAAADTPTLRRPGQRLASALTLMQKGSGRRQRELAQKMGVHESYASRMLSGQRDPSWKHVKIICEMCGIDPELMKPLWEAAAGVQPSDTAPPPGPGKSTPAPSPAAQAAPPPRPKTDEFGVGAAASEISLVSEAASSFQTGQPPDESGGQGAACPAP
ncbi:hypothetical protein SUDANB105_07909 [Streptomyces sp. enrichment culture]|uniref:helix-turn-helix domain-containing protein n=1 Tax=Streptomyces sp. enrichment culture TaxID=1795815 RepID=UPI003F575E7C